MQRLEFYGHDELQRIGGRAPCVAHEVLGGASDAVDDVGAQRRGGDAALLGGRGEFVDQDRLGAGDPPHRIRARDEVLARLGEGLVLGRALGVFVDLAEGGVDAGELRGGILALGQSLRRRVEEA